MPAKKKKLKVKRRLDSAAYDRRNALGFEGDPYLEEAVYREIRRTRPYAVIETGAMRGNTTRKIALITETLRRKGELQTGCTVMSSEINPASANQAKETLRIALRKLGVASDLTSSQVYNINSVDMLWLAFSAVSFEVRVVFYLDAHWGAEVLPDELRAIATLIERKLLDPDQVSIFIHDWDTGVEGLGFDRTARGNPLGMADSLIFEMVGLVTKAMERRGSLAKVWTNELLVGLDGVHRGCACISAASMNPFRRPMRGEERVMRSFEELADELLSSP